VVALESDLARAENPASGAHGTQAASLPPDVISRVLLNAAFATYVLRDTAREIDIVAYDPETNRYVIALLETGREQGVGFIRRLKERAQQRMQLQVAAGVADYPEHGFTVDDLVSRARAECDRASRARCFTMSAVAGASRAKSGVLASKETA
jgi:hypothetical protein